MRAVFKKLYNLLLRNRRLRRLTDILLPYMPENGIILDLGCGNGDLATLLKKRIPQLDITGIEITPNINASIPITVYDGETIPYPDNHFDSAIIITVLHHTDDYIPLLKEAKRVVKNNIILLDHQYASRLEWLTLACIDWPGNVPFGVYTPLNFKKRTEWTSLFRELDLQEVAHNNRLYLFGKIVDSLLGKNMHFISVLQKSR